MTSCLRTSRSLRCVATARASSIQRIKMDARNGTQKRPRWPVIILRTPKRMGLSERNRWSTNRRLLALASSAHGRDARDPGACAHPRKVVKSYRPMELFDDNGQLRAELVGLPSRGERRISAHLAGDVIDRVAKLGTRAAYAKHAIRDKLVSTGNILPATATTCRRSLAGLGVEKQSPLVSARQKRTAFEPRQEERESLPESAETDRRLARVDCCKTTAFASAFSKK
jgi:XFP N-terminal domain